MSDMFGILLSAVGSFFGEISSSIGKWEVSHKKEHVYTMGFLNTLGGFGFFLLIVLFLERSFLIHWASWPLLLILLVLSMLQAHVTVQAIARAERSAFSFFRTGTIPLVLIIDLALGYRLSSAAMMGIAFIVIALFWLYKNHGINRRGLGSVIFSAINAAIVISLFKYLVASGENSVSSIQILACVPQLIYFYICARRHKQHPLRLLRDRAISAQMLAQGLGSVFISFSFLFAPASIVVTADRSFGVIFAFLFGHKVFHEKKFFLKGCVAAVILAGILLLPR